MVIVAQIVLSLTALGVAASPTVRGSTSRVLRPYISLLLNAGLGMNVGSFFSGLQDFFLVTAKVISVLAYSGLHLHLTFMVARPRL